MDALWAVMDYTIKEHLRHKIYLTFLFFGLILLGGGVVISSLAIDEQTRMMLDLGLAGMEFLALMTIVFVTVNLVLEEVENRSIYLMLSHPIKRSHYIVGRFLGTVTAISVGMLGMAVLHVLMLLLHGWSFDPMYVVSVVVSIAKVSVVGSLALFLSLATTSTASAMAFTIFFWFLGHFSNELVFMSDRSSNPLIKAFVWIFHKAAPDFSLFNLRDFWQAGHVPPVLWFGWMSGYTVFYISIMLFLTSWIFFRKEV